MSLLVLLLFMLSGIVLSKSIFTKERSAVVLWLGLVLGLTEMMWLPALFSFFLGFGALSQLFGVLMSVLIAVAMTIIQRKTAKPEQKASSNAWLFVVMPVFLLSAYLLYTHTLSSDASGALFAGQSTFGDMCLHLGFITSLSTQGTFPPLYSIIPNTPVGYPFLCDSISSTLSVLGLPLRWAYMLPMLIAFFAVFCGAFFLFEAWLKDARKTIIGFALFFLGGGFGFVYFMNFLRNDPENFNRIFTAFYETPTNLVDENIKWVNPIADLMIPQRATLFGWVLLFACLFLLYKAVFENEKKYFIPLGLLAGALPMVHTHSFLALAIISAVLFVRSILKEGLPSLAHWLPYIVIAAALALPQLLRFTFHQSSAEGFLRFSLNWANDGDNYLWFYIKNIGLVYILLLPAFLNAKREDRAFYGASLLILLICEFLVFQPNPYDNNKLLYVWHLLGCALVGGFLVDVYDKLRGLKGRSVLAAMVLFVCVFGGLLTLGREAVSRYMLFTPIEVETAAFIKDKTPSDALFLTADNHNNTVAALTGRNIVRGTGSYLYYHGVDDDAVAIDVNAMFTDPFEREELLAAYKVDYIYISDYERSNYEVDEAAIQEAYPLIFERDGVQIYAVSNRARSDL